MPGPRVSVVVATRDRADRLRRLLDSLRAQTLRPSEFEVIVVDDGSRDGTAGVLATAGEHGSPTLRTLCFTDSAGPATRRDQGWRAASADLIAFTDDDCEADPGWLQALLSAAEAAPDTILQGRTDPIEAERDRLGPFARTMSVTRLGPYYQTCNIAYPRAVLEAVNGFDLSFPLPVGEDSDLAWRALAAGATARFVEDARVHHAVNVLGPKRMLRDALRWGEVARVMRLHPGLRREALTWGVFQRPSHCLLTVALAGALLSRRLPAATLAAYPYLRHLEQRWGESPELAPYLVAYDAVEVGALLRGSIRHRVLVI